MADDLSGLVPDFADRLRRTLEACAAQGLTMRVGERLRPPQVQAEYYTRARTQAQIDAAVQELRSGKATHLAKLLAAQAAQPARRWNTNAMPGLSWHQWGEAADCDVRKDERSAVEKGRKDAFLLYAECAEAEGLTAGLRFSNPDAGHVQLRRTGSPREAGMTLAEINKAMRTAFGEDGEAAAPPDFAPEVTEERWAPLPSEKLMAARTVCGEARGEPHEGKVAVAWVIRNRWVRARRRDRGWGFTISQICVFPAQFSCWSVSDIDPRSPLQVPIGALKAEMAAVEEAFAPDAVDPTEGCDHFFNPALANPPWAAGMRRRPPIGKHVFLDSGP